MQITSLRYLALDGLSDYPARELRVRQDGTLDIEVLDPKTHQPIIELSRVSVSSSRLPGACHASKG